jgi:heme/copper-type cytochrome/quinol oxidase subunit 4/cytochrome c2
VHAEAPSYGSSPSGMYVAVGVISLVLTAMAFYVVLTNTALKAHAVLIIVLLAIAQVALQTFLFMHLRGSRRVYSLFFGYGTFIAIVAGWGISYVLTSYTPPGVAPAKPLTQAQLLAEGQQIVSTQCVACHVVNGQGGHIGPDLNAVMAGQVNLVPGGRPTDPNWLASWIADPPGVWSGAKMPNLGLSPDQVQAVVLYLKTKVK